jgi:hypothetical protein
MKKILTSIKQVTGRAPLALPTSERPPELPAAPAPEFAFGEAPALPEDLPLLLLTEPIQVASKQDVQKQARESLDGLYKIWKETKGGMRREAELAHLYMCVNAHWRAFPREESPIPNKMLEIAYRMCELLVAVHSTKNGRNGVLGKVSVKDGNFSLEKFHDMTPLGKLKCIALFSFCIQPWHQLNSKGHETLNFAPRVHDEFRDDLVTKTELTDFELAAIFDDSRRFGPLHVLQRAARPQRDGRAAAISREHFDEQGIVPQSVAGLVASYVEGPSDDTSPQPHEVYARAMVALWQHEAGKGAPPVRLAQLAETAIEAYADVKERLGHTSEQWKAHEAALRKFAIQLYAADKALNGERFPRLIELLGVNGSHGLEVQISQRPD